MPPILILCQGIKMRANLLLLLLLLLTVTLLILAAVSPAAAQPPAPAPGAPQAQAADSSGAGPVTVPPPSDKAMRYYRSGNVLWVISTLWGLAVPVLLLFTGFSARLRNIARRIG